jgi:hypothetical protein
MRRVVVSWLLVSLIILVVAEHRLSDDRIRKAVHPVPELWDPVEHAAWTPATGPLNCAMVMSLDRDNPYTFTSVDRGVPFDIDADGRVDRVSWTEAGSDVAFLAVDVNGDGRITSGRELVGDHTVAGAWNGPTALTALATEALRGQRRGVIDADNPLFFKLLLWADANHNGRSEPFELRAAHLLVSDIGLGYSRQHRRDRHGNESRYRGFVHIRTAGGPNPSSSRDDVDRRRSMYEVCLTAQ